MWLLFKTQINDHWMQYEWSYLLYRDKEKVYSEIELIIY